MPFSLRFLVVAFAWVVAPLVLRAQEAPAALHGKVEGRTYVSPTGIFKIAIPVLPELGGNVTDTENVVTFEDDFNTHISIVAFPQDATQRWELSTRGLRDYLVYFFTNFVLADFKRTFDGTQVESARFGQVPGLAENAMTVSLLIPGGTMFGDKVPTLGLSEHAPVAKRGILVFVRNGHIFVVSIELAERVIEGKSYRKTTAEEDAILRQRLTDVIAKIEFAKPPAAPAPAPETRK